MDGFIYVGLVVCMAAFVGLRSAAVRRQPGIGVALALVAASAVYVLA